MQRPLAQQQIKLTPEEIKAFRNKTIGELPPQTK
jgi:hypothetical protein